MNQKGNFSLPAVFVDMGIMEGKQPFRKYAVGAFCIRIFIYLFP